MVSYINSKPKDYMLDGAIDAADWLTRTLEVQGYRIDDVKGMAVEAVRRVLDSKSMAGKFAVGEYFDGNPSGPALVGLGQRDGRSVQRIHFTRHWILVCSARWPSDFADAIAKLRINSKVATEPPL